MFPDFIKILFLEEKNQEPISNIAAVIKLYAKHKNDYYFILPLSDDTGLIYISKLWLKKEIKKDKDLFIMDYASELEDCLPQIEIQVLDIEELSRTVSAMEMYKVVNELTDKEIHNYKNANNYKYEAKNERIIFNDPLDVSNHTIILKRNNKYCWE